MTEKEIDYKIKINRIFNKAKLKNFEDRKVGYLKKDDFLELWNMKAEIIKYYELEGYSKKSIETILFNYNFKIINPLPLPIKVTNFAFAVTYSLVKDRESILTKHLDKDFNIWVNKMRKNAKKLAKEENNIAEQQKIIDKFEAQIQEGERYYHKIKNGEVEEVIRTNFEFITELYRPHIYIKYIDDHNKVISKSIYLRKDVLNIVYEDDIIIPKKSKSKIEKKLRKMKNVFGYYYIKE
jgi:hypothetical protein